MDGKTLEHFKNLFFEIKKNHLGKAALDEEILNVPNTGDDVDISQNERDRGLDIKLQSRQSLFIKKVDWALAKIDDGSFGECEECGEDISLARLFARPTACLCINCKEDQERGESHVLYEKKSKTNGKGIEFTNENSNLVNFKDLQKEKELKEKIILFNEGRS